MAISSADGPMMWNSESQPILHTDVKVGGWTIALGGIPER